MPVFSNGRGRQSQDVLRLHLPHHLFKRDGGQVVAFVNYDMAILGHEVLCHALAMEALYQGDVDVSRSPGLSSTDLSDLIDRDIEKCGQPFAPLVEQLGSMHENQSICLSGRDQICCRNGLAESSSGAQYALVMFQNLCNRVWLMVAQVAGEFNINRLPGVAFVLKVRLDLVLSQQQQDLVKKAPRQCQKLRKFFDAAITLGLS